MIDGVRVFKDRIDGLPTGVFVHAIEAALTACMAGDITDLLNHQDDDVSITVQAHFVQFLHVA